MTVTVCAPPPTSITSNPPDYNQLYAPGEVGQWNSSPAMFDQRHLRVSLLSRQRSRRISRRAPSPLPLSTKVFTFESRKNGHTWAELKVVADESLSVGIPTFLEGSKIEGEVKLYAAKAENIDSAIVSVKGQVITGTRPSEHFTFFEKNQTVWSRCMGNPRYPIKNKTEGPSAEENYTDKLQGTFTWPYSIDIPKEVFVASKPKGEPRVYTLPESFWERHERVRVRYEICLRFIRGYFKQDKRITTQFAYIPFTVPGNPSSLRQIAYKNNATLPGPSEDPDGWHTCKTVRIQGRVDKTRDVSVYCTLSLAKPLAYTRGSAIPCWLSLRSQDKRALEILATPKAPTMRLRRCVKAAADTGKYLDDPAWKDQIEHSELATWWSAKETRHTRELHGELHLKVDLRPSSAMAHFRVEYSAVLFPFDSLAFESETSEDLFEQPVDITTSYTPGPRPRLYVPPEYESPDTIAAGLHYQSTNTNDFDY